MKFNIHSKLNQAAVALALIVSVSSCNDKDNPTPTITDSKVNVVNVVNDVAELNAHLGTVKLNNTTLKFAEFDKYYTFKAAKADLSIFENTKTDTLASKNYDFKANEAYSAYVIGNKTDAEIVLVKDELKAPASGKSKIRLANFINTANKIDLFIGSATEATANDLAFKAVNNFVEVNAAAEIALKIKVDGQNDVLASIEKAKLEAGKIYTVLAYETKVDGTTKIAIKLISQK